MAGRAQVGGQGSYRGHSGWNLRSELAFAGRTGNTVESGVRKGAVVQTRNPPTKTDRYSGAAESEVRGGYQVTPPPPTRTDTYSGAEVSGVGVTQGKRINQAELGRKHSRERRKMRCRSEGVKYLFVRPFHQVTHIEDLSSSAHSEAFLIERSL